MSKTLENDPIDNYWKLLLFYKFMADFLSLTFVVRLYSWEHKSGFGLLIPLKIYKSLEL